MNKLKNYTNRHKFVATTLLFSFLLQSCNTTLNSLGMNEGNQQEIPRNKQEVPKNKYGG